MQRETDTSEKAPGSVAWGREGEIVVEAEVGGGEKLPGRKKSKINRTGQAGKGF